MLGQVLVAAVWWTVFLLVFRRDRRRVRNGVLFLIAVYATVPLVIRLVSTALPLGDVLLLAAAVTLLLGVAALGVFLVANGLTMVRKEGRTLGNALSLLAAIALFATPVAAFALIATLTPWGLGLGVLLALVALHLGAAFLVFLSASLLYQLFPRPLAAEGVIVLGSGLVRNQVSRLLRSRLDRAVTARSDLLARGRDPLLVPSGGRGSDEQRAEGAAMAEYLLEETEVPAERVRPETAARTTEENLRFSHAILDEAAHRGPYLIATSRYHAFRAGLIARRLGFADEAVGGPTAFYYVPSATLREFVAVLSYRKGWNIAALLPSLALTGLIVRAAALSL